MKTIFREYDIRGIFEKELNEKMTKAIGYFFGKKVKEIGDYVSVGYDARTHSPKICEWLVSGFNKAGLKVLNMGLVPTPVNYFGNFREFQGVTPSGSIMITGSHNPPEYNGFKITLNKDPFFGEMIYALGDEILKNLDFKIEDDINSTKIDAKEQYIDYLTDEFKDLRIDKKIIFDAGNGAAGEIVKKLALNLGLDSECLYCNPDGTFPNHHPDPSEEENLADVQEKLKGDFEFGFAYDGDGDRIAVLTKKHNFKGDELAIILSKQMKNPVVIGEVKCSQVMYDEINARGTAVMYKTGHSNLKVKIKELNADLAAEVSGHIFFNDRYFGYDDAIYSTFRVLELIHNGVNLDKEVESLPKTYNTPEVKVYTTEQEKFPLMDKITELINEVDENFPKIKEIITVDGIRVIFEDGWGLVRASNTTPVLVTRFESTNEKNVEIYQNAMVGVIEKAKKILLTSGA